MAAHHEYHDVTRLDLTPVNASHVTVKFITQGRIAWTSRIRRKIAVWDMEFAGDSNEQAYAVDSDILYPSLVVERCPDVGPGGIDDFAARYLGRGVRIIVSVPGMVRNP